MENKYMEVFNCVRSALSKNGNLKINKLINGYMLPFSDYTTGEWYDIWNDWTCHLLSARGKNGGAIIDDYDSSKCSLQTWINWQVLKLIQERARNWKKTKEEKYKMKSYEYDIEDIYGGLESSDLNPEEALIAKETRAEIDKYVDFIPVWSGEVTHEECAKKLGMSVSTVKRRVNELKKIVKEIREL